mgnify:CR=1 FL=1
METITSRQNPLMTHIRKLAGSAAYRRQTGQCLCDSPKLLRAVSYTHLTLPTNSLV